MKLTAASALLVQALPVLSREYPDLDSIPNPTSLTLSLPAELEKPSFVSPNLLLQKPQSQSSSKRRPPVHNKRPFHKFQKDSKSVGASECVPDVGVLSCGFGMYCQADDQSSLGGLCAPLSSNPHLQRHLEEDSPNMGYYFCELHEGEFDCDCSEWDSETSSGTVTCTLHNDDCYCDNVCFDLPIVYKNVSSSWEYTHCVYFTSPYVQTFCYAIRSDDTCDVTLDGESCTSCMVDSGCGVFDCDNVGMSTGDFCYTYPAPPIYRNCDNETTPYDACTICPNGLVYPDAQVPFAGDTSYSCTALDAAGEAGQLDDSTCSYVATTVKETCCGEEPQSCNICGQEDMDITYPRNIVALPNGINHTCLEMFNGSLDGEIPEAWCPFVQGVTIEHCGCIPLWPTPMPSVAPVSPSTMPTMLPVPPTASPTAASTTGIPSIITTDLPTASPTVTADAIITTDAPTMSPTPNTTTDVDDDNVNGTDPNTNGLNGESSAVSRSVVKWIGLSVVLVGMFGL
eukprot:Nitzschia sp. Nitz4//scaffold54_size114964//54555//56176//NITZ4_003850-RA/size114964-augustus-gene-0.3-mRNA-1//1//CDS//3329554348//6066//frame0